VALFAWSAWAGLAAILAVASGIAGIVGREKLGQRRQKRQCRALLTQALAERGSELGEVFHGHHGIAAFGIATTGRTIAYASAEGSELYDVDVILEARAVKLPQGDFKIGISVPGRVSGKPYWQELIVSRRRDAVRWVETLGPTLGEKLKADGLG
jgi:hypothetical protein